MDADVPSRIWNIVVADDNPDDRSEIRRLLLMGSERRYHFIDVDSGVDTHRAIIEPIGEKPTCLVLDFHLPDSEAPEIIENLMGKRGLSLCPIVVITGSDSGNVGTLAIRAGAQDFVGKNWMTPESLTRAVENAISRWRMARNIAVHLAVVEILASAPSEDKQLADTLDLIAEQTNWNAGGVWIVDEISDMLKCYHVWEKPGSKIEFMNGVWRNQPRTRTDGFAGYVWTHKRCGWWTDIAALAAVKDCANARLIADAGFSTVCAFPILIRTECIGVIELYGVSIAERDADLARVFEAISNQLGQAIERTRAERCIRENEEQLRRSLHYYDFFIAVLGHDLRNPLGAILTGAELGTRLTDDEKTRKVFQRIRSSGQRMQRLIEQLLDVTRIRSAGGLTLQYAAADLRNLTKSVLDEITDLHGDVSIDFQVVGTTTGEWDTDRLAQVLSNLIGNAVQHAVGSRRIGVHIAGSNPDVVEFSIHNDGLIAQDVIPTLFDPFVKATHRTHSSGLGLGLYISQQIILAHCGQISVQSDAQQGTTFHVTLPRLQTTRPIDMACQTPSVNPPIMCEVNR
jgi:signal transduction histidine kinase/FixJ family two-component response regulator